jgi:hypothetical protein
MKKIILTAFVLTLLSFVPVKAEHRSHRDRCASYNPYPYAHFHPYRSQVVYSSRPVYVVPAATYAAPAVVYSSPVVYYPSINYVPYHSHCHSSGVTIKIRF